MQQYLKIVGFSLYSRGMRVKGIIFYGQVKFNLNNKGKI